MLEARDAMLHDMSSASQARDLYVENKFSACACTTD